MSEGHTEWQNTTQTYATLILLITFKSLWSLNLMNYNTQKQTWLGSNVYLLSSLRILRSKPILQEYVWSNSLGVLVKGLAGLTGVHSAKNPYCFILPFRSGLMWPSNLKDCIVIIKKEKKNCTRINTDLLSCQIKMLHFPVDNQMSH